MELSAQTLSDLGDLIGILAFAIAGILAADGKKLDPVGTFVLAFTTAFGGGILRDIIIDNRPFWWVAHENYVWLTLVLTIFTPTIVRHFRDRISYSAFIWADAIGLGFFSASGTAVSLAAGLSPLPATLLGVSTGAAGGMLRDVFLDRLPLVLSDKKPYASVAFAGCWLYAGLSELGLDKVACLWISSIFICLLRMLCWYRNWEIRHYDNDAVPISQKAGPPHQLEIRDRHSKRPAGPPLSQAERARSCRDQAAEKQGKRLPVRSKAGRER